MSDPRPARPSWRERLLVAGFTLLARALYASWRVTTVSDAGVRRLRAARRPFVFSLWHGEMLPLLTHHRDEGVSVLISEHRDGERIARAVTRLGFRTVRGSTTRGGMRALLGLVRELEQGREIAVTPDGPRGPAHRVAPGLLIAAHRAGVPILPVRVHASRAWRLGSWDAFLIPKPFAAVTVAYGDPFDVEATDARGASEQAGRVEALMAEAGALAVSGGADDRAAVGASPGRRGVGRRGARDTRDSS